MNLNDIKPENLDETIRDLCLQLDAFERCRQDLEKLTVEQHDADYGADVFSERVDNQIALVQERIGVAVWLRHRHVQQEIDGERPG